MEIQIAVIVISILTSAFFSGMEIAFISANKLYIELEKKKEGLTSRILTKLTAKPSKFITTMLVGNNISLVIYGYFMGAISINFFASYIPNEFLMLLTQTIISTLIILVTAEFLPKAIFRIYATETLKGFAIPAYFFYLLFYMVSDFVIVISDFILKKIFKSKGDEVQLAFSKEEIGNYISEQLESVDKNKEIDSEIQIFQNALEFNEVKAREVMIPRTEIIAVEVSESLEKLRGLFIDKGLSKIIVFKNSLDDIIGYVHSFEMFKKPKNINSILLPIELVPETMLIIDVLNLLIKKRRSIAVVIDEYGGTSGIITVEDIIEELFGEIQDEHDKLELLENKINKNEFQFSGRLEVDYINEKYQLNLPEEEAYETLGGLIVYHTGKIPELNEIITIENYKFTILKVSDTKIEAIYLKVLFKED